MSASCGLSMAGTRLNYMSYEYYNYSVTPDDSVSFQALPTSVLCDAPQQTAQQLYKLVTSHLTMQPHSGRSTGHTQAVLS